MTIYHSDPEKVNRTDGYEWRVTSALITDDLKQLGQLRTFHARVNVPSSVTLTDAEQQRFLLWMHKAVVDQLIDMRKL